MKLYSNRSEKRRGTKATCTNAGEPCNKAYMLGKSDGDDDDDFKLPSFFKASVICYSGHQPGIKKRGWSLEEQRPSGRRQVNVTVDLAEAWG